MSIINLYTERLSLVLHRLTLLVAVFLCGNGAAIANTIVVELESLASQSDFDPFAVQYDNAASGEQYIVWPEINGGDSINYNPNITAGRIAIEFNLSANSDVQFNIAVNFPNGNDDSFFYRLDTGSWSTHNNQQSSGWQVQTPTTFNNVSAGDHTLWIVRRENGSGLDYVSLEADSGVISFPTDEVALTITKSVSDQTPNIGDVVEFTLTVSNSGPVDAIGVYVDDIVPSGFGNLQTGAFPALSNLNITGNTVAWTNIFVPSGGSVSATFSAEILPP